MKSSQDIAAITFPLWATTVKKIFTWLAEVTTALTIGNSVQYYRRNFSLPLISTVLDIGGFFIIPSVGSSNCQPILEVLAFHLYQKLRCKSATFGFLHAHFAELVDNLDTQWEKTFLCRWWAKFTQRNELFEVLSIWEWMKNATVIHSFGEMPRLIVAPRRCTDSQPFANSTFKNAFKYIARH